MKKIIIATVAIALGLQAGLIGVMLSGVNANVALPIAVCVCVCLIAALTFALVSGLILGGKRAEEEPFMPTEEPTPADPDDEIVEPIEPNKGEVENPPVEIKDEKVSYFENYLAYVDKKNGEGAAKIVRSDIEALLGGGTEDRKGRINEIVAIEAKNNRVNGLVVGRVQAGKTQNYTGLITKAIDQKWNVVIVLTSNNVALANQTKLRLKNDLKESGLEENSYVFIEDFCTDKTWLPTIDPDKIYVGVAIKQIDHLQGRVKDGGREAKGVCGFFAKNKEKLNEVSVLIVDDEADNCSLNSNQEQDVWDENDVKMYAEELRKKNEKIVSLWIREICLNLKFDENNDAWMQLRGECDRVNCTQEDVRRILGEESKYREILGLNKKCKFGILGLEVEIGRNVYNYFSGAINGEERKKLKKVIKFICEYERDRSKINDALCYIVGRSYKDDTAFNFKQLAYVGYTATPYGVLLNEKRDGSNPLQLDFIQSMMTAPEYFGLNKIFGNNSEGSSRPRMPIIKEIEQGEEFTVENLKKSIAWAYCTAAIRRSRRLKAESDRRSDRWTTMLINISRKIERHNENAKAIREFVRNLLKNKADFVNYCKETFNELSSDVSKEWFEKEYPDYNFSRYQISDISWGDVEEEIKRIKCAVIPMNSDNGNQDNYNWYIQDERYLSSNPSKKIDDDVLWIVVGGNKISRGLTFDGLTVSYFDRDTPTVNVDTLTQMGRWFGYRCGYELLPRVWMPSGTVGVMKQICHLENDLHDQISSAFENFDYSETEDNLNISILDISKRLTGRDAAAENTEAIYSPYVTRYLPYPQQDVVDVSSMGFNALVAGRDDAGIELGHRIHYWKNIEFYKVKKYVESVKELLSEYERSRLQDVLSATEVKDKSFDVAIADPDNKREKLTFCGHEIHPHGTECSECMGPGLVRFEKFSAQIDAWKAGVSQEIINAVRKETGENRVNSTFALKKLFEEVRSQGGELRPILQVGFIEYHRNANSRELLFTIAIYVPLTEKITDARIFVSGGDTAQPEKANNSTNSVQQGASSELAESSSSSSEGLSDTGTKDSLSTTDSVLTEEWSSEEVDRVRNLEARDEVERRQREQDEFNRVAQEATGRLREYIEGNRDQLRDGKRFTELWKEVLKNEYNEKLGRGGSNIIPSRFGLGVGEQIKRQFKKYNLPLEPYNQRQGQVWVKYKN